MVTSVEFYDALAPLFDVMTDWEERLRGEGPFLSSVLQRHAPLGELRGLRVLDVACGSGGHALELARWGCEVTGTDNSPTMLRLARQKAAEQALQIDFVKSSITELAEGLRPHVPFDAALCLGNSLPHLLTDEELSAGLRNIAGALRPGAILIIQNLNYDLRWLTQPRFFAAQGGVVDGHQVLVWRFADYEQAERRIAFHVALFSETETGWTVNVHTTPQRPLFVGDLLAALEAAGFTETECFGSMSVPISGFDSHNSGDLVVVARRA